MKQTLKTQAGVGIGENNRGHGRSIEGTIISEHSLAEHGHDLCQHIRPRNHQGSSDVVRVQDRESEIKEVGCPSALAGPYPSGDPNPFHTQKAKSRPVGRLRDVLTW